MHPSRCLTRIHHGLLLAALLCILLARVAVPAGWMPVAGSGGIVLAPCSGMGAMPMGAHAMPGMAQAMPAADHKSDHHPDPAGDHPCSGAGVSVALDMPLPTLPATMQPTPAAVAPAVPSPGVGHRLAAPPPPPTGPPFHV